MYKNQNIHTHIQFLPAFDNLEFAFLFVQVHTDLPLYKFKNEILDAHVIHFYYKILYPLI